MRERVRLQAVERFEGGQKNREIAVALRVRERSVERWRRQWRERGEAGVLSKGSPGRPRLSEKQIAWLERELERGPLVHGWTDQRWTLAPGTTNPKIDRAADEAGPRGRPGAPSLQKWAHLIPCSMTCISTFFGYKFGIPITAALPCARARALNRFRTMTGLAFFSGRHPTLLSVSQKVSTHWN